MPNKVKDRPRTVKEKARIKAAELEWEWTDKGLIKEIDTLNKRQLAVLADLIERGFLSARVERYIFRKDKKNRPDLYI